MSPGLCLRLAAALALALLLSACAAEPDELSAWVAQQRAATQAPLEPVPPPQQHVAQAFLGTQARSPFDADQLSVLLRAERTLQQGGEVLAFELRRRREPLEALPLDTLTMVGSLQRGTEMVALVRAEGRVHLVRRGNHLGQNFGRVTAISASAITLREIVADPSGAWVERSTTLQLQEGTGS